MLRSILIGVNGTRGSQSACELGLTWAKAAQIPVTCVGVVDAPAILAPQPMPLGASAFKAERDADLLAHARKAVADALAAACQQAQTLGVECHPVALEGAPAEILGAEAQRHDLVVLGRRSTPHSDREPAASNTLTDILRHASRPVVVAGAPPQGSAVVVAYDGSAQAARTLQAFVQSGLHFGHPLHLVGVGDQPQEMHARLMRALDYVKTHGRTAEVHVLPIRGSVGETLAQYVRQMPCGLLVMGVYGQPRLKELLFGSVTTSLLKTVPVPLFLHH
jgi:nucleotide-binding universal stress UspA family protein